MDKLDTQLAKSAAKKLSEGKIPLKREAEALKKRNKEEMEEMAWRIYANCPQKHYKAMTGRDGTILREQESRLGIPCGRAVIDLGKVLRWVHDWIAEGAAVASQAEDEGSEALEKYRRANASLAEMDLAKRRMEMVDRSDVRMICGSLAARAVRCMEILEVSIVSELSVWISDPAIREMQADDRARKVREFVRKVCDDVRRAEADGVDKLISEAKED